MALTPTIKGSSGGAIVVSNTLTPTTRVVLAGASVILNFPTLSLDASDAGVIVATNFLAPGIQVSEFGAVIVAQGRIFNPKLHAWTFSLDGHDFYVLRLGETETLIYDLYSEQWVDWSTKDIDFWRPNSGMNWIGGQKFATEYGSDIVVGDDSHGLIYFLDPEQPYDEPPIDYATAPIQYFERIVMGQAPLRGRETVPCYAVWLTTDMGNPAYIGAGVTLYTSDDAGETFDDHGLITVTQDVRTPELSWYSLGQITAPGRLFKIVDDGAVARIDCLEMDVPDDGR